MFRKWANSVLKEYLLKGYVINENRTLITNENYVNLINKVDSIDKRLSVIKKTNLEKEKVFFDGDCSTYINDKYHDRFLLIDQNDFFTLALH